MCSPKIHVRTLGTAKANETGQGKNVRGSVSKTNKFHVVGSSVQQQRARR